MGITTHHVHCGNKVNRELNQQYGRVCRAVASEVIVSLARFPTVRIEACGHGEVKDVAGWKILQ